MIPPFNEHGYLPPGVHPATFAEVEARFGCDSEIRGVQMESLRRLVDLAHRAGVVRLVINGSFVTDVLEPNDVDCVLLMGAGFPRDLLAETELLAGLPFLELSIVNRADFESTHDTQDNGFSGCALVSCEELTARENEYSSVIGGGRKCSLAWDD